MKWMTVEDVVKFIKERLSEDLHSQEYVNCLVENALKELYDTDMPDWA